MSKPQSPCLNCENRHSECHSHCEKYLYFKDALNEYNEKVYNNKQKQRELDEFNFRKLKKDEYKY